MQAKSLSEEQRVTHLLSRTSFGPRPGDPERLKQSGIDKHIHTQLHPEHLDDSSAESKLALLPSIRMSTTELLQKYPAPRQNAQRNQMRAMDAQLPRKLLEELSAQKILRAVYSERQLQEVMTDFWFNHFNVFWNKGADRWLTTDFEMNTIRPNVFAKFKELLMATAKSPAMLFYLDNSASRQLGINENYARELMELHTMGVDSGYTQNDIQEVARAFTGWSIERPRQGGPFMFRPRMHDYGEKVVLGHKINSGGIRDGETVIDILAKQPSTSRFMSTKLVRRFVSDDPPASLVDRVAAIYKQTDGDIREMVRTIISSTEFYSPEAVHAKTKTPFEFVISAIRLLNGTTDGSRQLMQTISRMGQPLYQCQPPTGFPDRADHWMSNGAILERLNFVTALAANRIPGTMVQFTEPIKEVVLKLGSPEFQRR